MLQIDEMLEIGMENAMAVTLDKKEYLGVLKKEHIYRAISLSLSIILLILAGYALKDKAGVVASIFAKREPAPYALEVHRIMDRLQYSGLEMFKKKEVFLSLDFKEKTWQLHNFRRFDKKGDVILEKGRYGTCGELAAYTYKYIKPLFGDKFYIEFAQAMESTYFHSPMAAHTVLYIAPKKEANIYILDPSFHRYGALSEFEDYLFTNRMPELPFVAEKKADIVLPISGMIPLLIRNDYLLGFVVEDNEGRFDEQNFVIALAGIKKHTFVRKHLFALRNNNGTAQILKNKDLKKHLYLSESEYTDLKDKIFSMFEEVKR